MTKKELLKLLAPYPDHAEVVIEVHDTVLHEDLYNFTFDPIEWEQFEGLSREPTTQYELRLCPIKNTIN